MESVWIYEPSQSLYTLSRFRSVEMVEVTNYNRWKKERRRCNNWEENRRREKKWKSGIWPDVGKVSNARYRWGTLHTRCTHTHTHTYIYIYTHRWDKTTSTSVERSKLVHPGAACTQPRSKRVFSGVNELAADISRASRVILCDSRSSAITTEGKSTAIFLPRFRTDRF